MNPRVKDALRSTIFLKATSLIIGLLFWSIISTNFHSSVWLTVPVCFYNNGQQKIEAPETVLIELKGKRSHLRTLDKHSCAIHIDAQTLKPGPNQIEVTSDLLFLPATMSVTTVIPHNLLVKVTT